MNKKLMSRVDVQVSLLATAVVIISSLSIFALIYTMSYQEMLGMMEDNVNSLAQHIEQNMDKDIFQEIQTADDMDSQAYQDAHTFLDTARMISGTKYLYTATRNDAGELIYHVDGLGYDDPDFRDVGDLIEPEFQEPLIAGLNGETVMPNDILNTEWGDVFVAYYPLHNDQGDVVAVLGIEFPADSQYQSFQTIRLYTMWLIIAICIIMSFVVRMLFRRISNPHYKDIYNTDSLTSLKNRTAFEVDIQNSIHKKQMDGVTLVLTDLNGLKQVNDKVGHAVGDRYIQGCAQALLSAPDRHYVVYRIGGDEFATLFPAGTGHQVADYIGHVKGQVAALQCPEIPAPGVAMGAAICHGHDLTDWEAAQHQADQAMYADKQSFYQAHPHLDKRV